MRSTNGYESRRQQYLAEVASTKIKAAAAASAIALVQTKLAAGQSTKDYAVKTARWTKLMEMTMGSRAGTAQPSHCCQRPTPEGSDAFAHCEGAKSRHAGFACHDHYR
jgi:hypothetical protein